MLRFVALNYAGTRLGTYDSREAAFDAIAAAVRQAGAPVDESDLYEVVECGSIRIVELGPSLGDCSDDEYAAECYRLEKCYYEVGADTQYSVCVRPVRAGEASGTYVHRIDGSLQILGYSIPKPDDLEDLSDKAFALFCKGGADTRKAVDLVANTVDCT
jgi:hypothetical protein